MHACMQPVSASHELRTWTFSAPLHGAHLHTYVVYVPMTLLQGMRTAQSSTGTGMALSCSEKACTPFFVGL